MAKRIAWSQHEVALLFRAYEEFAAGAGLNNQFTKVTLFSKIPFELTAKEDRVRTCYMFACLAFVNSSAISNADIRSAFGLEENDKVKASRVIRDTMSAKLIKPVDPSTAPRYMRYVPFWA